MDLWALVAMLMVACGWFEQRMASTKVSALCDFHGAFFCFVWFRIELVRSHAQEMIHVLGKSPHSCLQQTNVKKATVGLTLDVRSCAKYDSEGEGELSSHTREMDWFSHPSRTHHAALRPKTTRRCLRRVFNFRRNSRLMKPLAEHRFGVSC